MDKRVNLPFKVGDLAEAKSFEEGFRGAWFRCKIREISKRKRGLGHVSEYYDFPDEKLKWGTLYQVPCHYMGRAREKHRELMLRPRYPPVYRENQIPLVSDISEVSVIIDGNWRVGDLVDWWKSECYWSGKIIELHGDDEAQIKLKPPPDGEGCVEDILFEDIRPSLDWSLEHGWTVPSESGGSGRVCARIFKPLKRDQAGESDQGADKPRSAELRKQSVGNSSEELKDAQDTSNNCMEYSPEDDVKEEQHHDVPHEYRSGDAVSLYSKQQDTLEAAIMDLEELLTKIKWMKNILKNEVPSSASGRPEWEIVNHHPIPSAPEQPK